MQVTVGAFVLRSLIGLVFALMMVSKVRAIALFAIGVVNVIRGHRRAGLPQRFAAH